MPGQVPNRSVTPIIAFLRDILRGKKHTNALRFANEQAARTQPPPDVPGGPYHKLSKIYYYARDVRREVEPPKVVVPATSQIESGEKAKEKPKFLTPNEVFMK